MGFNVRIFATALGLLASVASFAQGTVFTEASELNIIGKIMDGTPNPYHRVDTVKYKGFTASENNQVRCPAGLAVLFRTDSKNIRVKTQWGWHGYQPNHTQSYSLRGYDLYIRKDGKWIWAGDGAETSAFDGSTVTLVQNMDGSVKECMMYMPLYAEVNSCEIGIDEGAFIEPMSSPFRHRIAIFGSSYTHGISTNRPGMSYPMQFMRATGLQILGLGCSGNCKLQPYFADVLADTDAEAFIFDTFSNPDAAMIKERLIPFIDRLVAAHPGKPLIFQQTIYREGRNFNVRAEEVEQAKQDMAENLFAQILKDKKYKDVYFIRPDASDSHESSVDGTHPDDYGYYLWYKSIEKPVLKILRKYGIR